MVLVTTLPFYRGYNQYFSPCQQGEKYLNSFSSWLGWGFFSNTLYMLKIRDGDSHRYWAMDLFVQAALIFSLFPCLNQKTVEEGNTYSIRISDHIKVSF